MQRLWQISVGFAIVLGLFAAHTAATFRPALSPSTIARGSLSEVEGSERSESKGHHGESTTGAPCRIAGPAIALAELPEASGLAASRHHPGVLWSHNDSGDPIVFAIGADGSMKGRVRIAGAEVDDWEDIAVGPCPSGSCLYIADIGDNHSSRSSITVYRVPEPAPGDQTSRPAEAFRAAYSDGPRDAEGLFVTHNGAARSGARGPHERGAADRGRDPGVDNVFVVSKEEPVAVYRFPLRAGATMQLQRVASLGETGGRVTAASESPDGRWIVVRTHRAAIFYRTPELVAGKVNAALQFDLSELREPQGEGVALLSNGTVYLSGEGGRGGTLARITCNLPR